MTRRRVWTLLVTLAAQGPVACSLLIPQDLSGGGASPGEEGGTSAGDEARAEDSRSDGSGPRDAGDDATLHHYSFDLGCSGWALQNSKTSTETAAALSGSACRVCPDVVGAQSEFAIFANIPDELVGPRPLTFLVNARAAPGASGEVQVTVMIYERAERLMSNSGWVGATYTPLGTSQVIEGNAVLYVKAQASNETDCIVIDEGRLLP